MINLLKETTKRYYFVKDKVIFDIKSVYNGNDSCAIKLGGDNNDILPSIKVTDVADGLETEYFLDVFITDGDIFNGSGSTPTFLKTVHVQPEEAKIPFCDYYKQLCEEQLKSSVLNYYNLDYSWFKENIEKLGIPAWMVKDKGYTVTSKDNPNFEQINFTEDYLDSIKEESVKEAAFNAANNVTKKYGYKVTDVIIQKV